MTIKNKKHIHVDDKIKKLVDFMTDKNVQHLKFEGIELTLTNEAFNSDVYAVDNFDASSKKAGKLKPKDPFFENDDDDGDISEDILFHSS